MSDDLVQKLLDKISSLESSVAKISDKMNEIRQLVGPFAATFPDGAMLTQSIHGLKYFVDPEDMVITPNMVIYRQWEADLSNVFRYLCKSDAVVVDIGANIGYFTVLAASLIGNMGSGKVYAFEPNPKLARLLEQNIEINWSIAPVYFNEMALADYAGEVSLHIPRAHGANASLSAPDEYACDSVTVNVKKLDDALPKDVEVDLMKIDVEGHEASVLRGAREVISRSPNLRLIMEWSRKQMDQAGVDRDEFAAILEGFTPYRIEVGSAPFDHPESFEWLLDQEYTDVLLTRAL